jgi:FG-GAP repeat
MNLQDWIALCFNRSARSKKTSGSGRPRTARDQRVRLGCEQLETRLAPTIGVLSLTDPGNTVGDSFGTSVALSGSKVLVGQPGVNNSTGAAYLYNTSGQLLRTFTDPNNTSRDDFGFSVALSGTNEVLVGAPGVTEGSAAGAGAAYLFSTTGQLLETFQDPSNTFDDEFGFSVALSGGMVLVGAPGENSQGAAYLYNTSGQSLQIFQDPNNSAFDQFGCSVALSGTNVLVGADGVNYAAGAVYLYNGSYQLTVGSYQLIQTFEGSINAGNNQFGQSVALSGSNVLVGADNVGNFAGAAYLFDASGYLLQTFQDPTDAMNDQFGYSVALSGSNVLVGATGVNNSAGAAYLFNTSGQLFQTFPDANDAANDRFGFSVAVSGSSVLVGAPNDNSEGAAYLYEALPSLSALVGNNQSTVVGTAFGTTLEAQVSDGFGNPVSGAAVTFAESDGAGGASATFTGSTTVFTNSAGLAIAPVLTANTVAGSFTVTATVGSLSATYLLHNVSGAPVSIVAVGGTPQSTPVGSAFGTLLQAQVLDGDNNPVANVPVRFTVQEIVGLPFATFNASDTVLTNALGIATAPALTDYLPGSFSVTASAADVPDPVDFALTTTLDASISALGGSPQDTRVGFAFGSLLQAQVLDSDNKPIANVPVTFAVPASGATGTFNALPTVLTNTLGIATAPALTASHEPGTFTVTATAAGVADPAEFSLTNTTVPAAIKAAAGALQSTTVNTTFDTRLEVLVTDGSGSPVSGITVDFEMPGAGASGGFLFTDSEFVVTNASGIATAPELGANTVAGVWTADAWVVGVATPAAFTLTNLVGPPSTVKIHGGNNQSATVGKAFATVLQALVVDAFGNPVSGASVTFAAGTHSMLPGGTFAGGKTTAVATTGATGVARAPALTANTVAGTFSVEAELTSSPLVNTEFSLTNKADPPHERIIGQPESATVGQDYAQPLSVRVTDYYDNPIIGAALTFTAPANGPSGTFSGSRTVTVITGANGVAVAPTFTANTRAGTFLVALSIPGVRLQTVKLTNLPGPAAAVRAVAGTTQTVAINSTLRTLAVEVTDAYANVIQGVPVTFAVQPNITTGAGGIFSGKQTTVTVTTFVNGNAIAPVLKANGKPGAFAVSASILGGTADELFTLTNL